jgi:hypothetical protein
MQGFGQFEPVNLDDFERFIAAELASFRSGATTEVAESRQDEERE